MAKRYLKETKHGIKERIVMDDANPAFVKGLVRNGFVEDKNFKGAKTKNETAKEIKELRDKAIASQTVTATVSKPGKKEVQGEVEAKVVKPEANKEESKNELKELKTKYIKEFKKQPPRRYASDVEWIKKELEK